jgi:hypothetical protein
MGILSEVRLWHWGDGRHKLPVKADIRQAIGKDVGDTVTVLLEERIR